MSTLSTDAKVLAAIIGAFVLAAVLSEWRRRRRLKFINSYEWPPGLIARLRREHPGLSTSDVAKVEQALRQFFRAYLNGGRRHVAMPSQAADDLWHEFILYTKAYDAFCSKAFGRFLHHTPAAVLSKGQKQTNEGLRRVWWQCCREESIDAKAPLAMPLLFALDSALNLPGGYQYVPDCKGFREVSVGISIGTQCCNDFSSTAFDGTTDGLGDGDGSSGDGDGGGGCGGD